MKNLDWRVNTPGLIKEIMSNNHMAILRTPLQIFSDILSQVADRAIKIDDKELNKLMLRLALYENGDPYSKDYDAKAVNEYLES